MVVELKRALVQTLLQAQALPECLVPDLLLKHVIQPHVVRMPMARQICVRGESIGFICWLQVLVPAAKLMTILQP